MLFCALRQSCTGAPGILLFKGRCEFTLLWLLTQPTKPQWNFLFPDMENRKQNYKLGEMKTNCCMQDITSEARGEIYANISCFCRGSAKFRAGACSHFYWLFFVCVILLENHSQLPIVWDIAESDLKYVNIVSIIITNLWGTLYAAQVCLGLHASRFWICFLILMLLTFAFLVLIPLYFLLQLLQ